MQFIYPQKQKWSQHNAWGSDFEHPRPFLPHQRPPAHTYTNSTVSARKQEYYLYRSFFELFSDTKALVLRKHFPVFVDLFIYFKWQVLYMCFVLKEIFASSEMEWWLSWVTSLIMSGFGKKATYWNGHKDFYWGPNRLCASSPVGTSCGWSHFPLTIQTYF